MPRVTCSTLRITQRKDEGTPMHLEMITDMDSTTPRTPMTPRQAADKVGVTERFLRNEVRRGHLRALRLGRMLRFRPEDVDDYITARLTTAPRA